MAEANVPAEVQMDEVQSTRPTTEANLFIMLLVGLVGTVLISLGTIPLKEGKLKYIYGIINERGPVQFFELFMSFMVGALVVMKMRIVRNQISVLADAPIDPSIDFNNDGHIQDMRKSILTLPNFSWSIVLNRAERILTLWLGSKDVSRVSDWAASQSERDTANADSSYTLARVLIWAIPIMGFIGTVMGLGSAVSGFSEFLSGSTELGEIKEAIGNVTIGLGVAFDTTLLALIMSVILMFPLSSVQRREESLFAEIDNYLNDVLIANLPTPEQQPIVIENLEDSIEAAFRRYIPDPDRYEEVFTRTIDRASKVVSERFNNLAKGYEASINDMVNRLSSSLSGVSNAIEQSMRKVIKELLIQEKALLQNRKKISDQEVARFKELVTGVYQATHKSADANRKTAEGLQKAVVDSSKLSLAAAKALAGRMDQTAKMAANIEDLLKIDKAVAKGMEGVAKAAEFSKTLAAMRDHLERTDELCTRMAKPRVITLREERAG